MRRLSRQAIERKRWYLLKSGEVSEKALALHQSLLSCLSIVVDPEAPKTVKNYATGETLFRGEEKAILWLCRYCGEPRDTRVSWVCSKCTIRDVASVFFSRYADDRVLLLIKSLRADATENVRKYRKSFNAKMKNRESTQVKWKKVLRKLYTEHSRGKCSTEGDKWLTQVFAYDGRYVGLTRREYCTGRIWPGLLEEIAVQARCFRFDYPMIYTRGLNRAQLKTVQRCQI